ncbi:hypothetical protein [Paenibacillus sp. NPDC058071]|uniref:hypothetical protein n=1 Tax=Paenibacillus sp. NPDC058071 TaxID=3346326 RepID=UPI0036DAC201
MYERDESVKIEIEEVETNFETIYNNTYFPKEYSDEIQKANALIIPYDKDFRDHSSPLFPEKTLEFYHYMKEASTKTDVVLDICVSDENFQELELHADLITLPTIILSSIVFPIVTGLITNYLSDKIKRSRSETRVKIELIIESKGKSKKISYEGDPDKFESTIRAIKRIDK